MTSCSQPLLNNGDGPALVEVEENFAICFSGQCGTFPSFKKRFFFSFTFLTITQIPSTGSAHTRINHSILGPREQAQTFNGTPQHQIMRHKHFWGTTPLTFRLLPHREEKLCPTSGFFSLSTAVKYLEEQLRCEHLY